MPRTVNAAGVKLVETFEQKRKLAYDDARPNYKLKPGDNILGTLTNGYGHTGPDVFIGQVVDDAQVNKWRDEDIAEAAAIVEAVVKMPINDNMFAALSSFVLNVGPGKKNVKDGFVTLKSGKPSTLLRCVNAGDFAGAARAFAAWNKTTIGGKRVESRGLTRRRAAEAELFTRPVPEIRAHEPFSAEPHATAIGEVSTSSPAKDVTFLGVATSVGSGVLAEATSQLEPLIAYSETIKAVFIALSLASVAFVLLKRWHDLKKEAA
jgi:lysozyme